MIFEHFKISDTDGRVVDLSDLWKVELRHGIIAMRQDPEEQILVNLYAGQLEQYEQLKEWLRCTVKTRFRKRSQGAI